MNARYDVVVIGAGPAGGVAAYAAARRGLSVLQLDRATFPRDKVCGCCLNARATALLERLGLGDILTEVRARPLNRLQVLTPGRSAWLRLTGSVSASRRRFDAALVERAQQAGVTFLDGVTATMGSLAPTTRRVHLRSREGPLGPVDAGVVVVADGLAGTALRDHPNLGARVRRGSRIGAGTIVDGIACGYADGVVTLASTRAGYVGTVRIEDGRLEVAAALDRHELQESGGPGALAERILHATGLPAIPDLAAAGWRGTPALTRRRPVFAGERFFVVGDAAGYVEPFTGEGIAWALEAAAEVSEWIPAPSNAWHPGLARAWARRWRAIVRRRQWGCRAVAAVLRRPAIAGVMIGLLGRTPRLAAPLVRHLTQPSSG